MDYATINTLIKRYIILPGDSVRLDSQLEGLVSPHFIYLGGDDAHWIVGRFEKGVRILSKEETLFLIESATKAKLNKFDGSEDLRSIAVDRMLERLDTPTFQLILRNSMDHKTALETSHANFKWKEIGFGLGIGLGLAGAVALGAAAWKWWSDQNKTQ
ncbi:MAG TPA: hypothetical protein ENJ82_04315 [Bacteroidetes bacterium]|nr:hypothetical protein [Bacteroidota bacterium]